MKNYLLIKNHMINAHFPLMRAVEEMRKNEYSLNKYGQRKPKKKKIFVHL